MDPEALVLDEAGVVIQPFQQGVILDVITSHLKLPDLMSLSATCRGLRSSLRKDLQDKSMLSFVFGAGGKKKEKSEIRKFIRYLEDSTTIPNNVDLSFYYARKTYDLGEVLYSLIEKKGPELLTLSLRLRWLRDFERLENCWGFLANLKVLELDFNTDEHCHHERTSRRTFEGYFRKSYLHNLRQLMVPVESLGFRPMKRFLYQADFTNLDFLQFDWGATLCPGWLRTLRRCTGIQFEYEGRRSVYSKYVKSLDQGNYNEIDLSSSGEDEESEDDDSEDEVVEDKGSEGKGSEDKGSEDKGSDDEGSEDEVSEDKKSGDEESANVDLSKEVA